MKDEEVLKIFNCGAKTFANILIVSLYNSDPKAAEALLDSVRSMDTIEARVDGRELHVNLYQALNKQLEEYLHR